MAWADRSLNRRPSTSPEPSLGPVDLDPERQSNRDKEVGRGGLSPLAPTRLHPGAQDPTVVITAGQADRSSRRSSLSGLVGHVPGVGRHHRAPTGIVVEAEEIGVAPDEEIGRAHV